MTTGTRSGNASRVAAPAVCPGLPFIRKELGATWTQHRVEYESALE